MSQGPARATEAPPQAAAGLTLRLHGDACVLRAGQELLPLRGRAAALVALVVLRPGLRREQAASLLWASAADPRQNLRQQLLRFRQTLGSALLEGEDTLQLAAGVALQAPTDGAELLAGEAAGSDEFGLWLTGQRQSLAQAQREPLRQALADAEAQGDLDTALRLAQSLLALDPQDEAKHAALMQLHYLRGEPSAGLQAYQRLVAMLSAHWGTQPAASSQAVAAALRRMGSAPAPLQAVASHLPVTLKRPPVMTGRSAEQAAVQAAWAEGKAVLLEGEAGMGKSRLLSDTLAGLASAALQAAGRPGDSGAPYSTLARLLRPALVSHAAQLSSSAHDALGRLGGSSGVSAPASPLPPGAMLAAVAELLGCAGADTVALDDLHFADAATLDLVSGLVSSLATAATHRRWLFAQRPAEAPAAAQTLRDALLELQRLAIVTLQPLDEAGATLLVDTLGITGLQGHALAPALVRHSGGNPLFLLETLKQGLADGSLARGELPRPASVGALIEQRLQRLSAQALALARVAAIAGVDFSIELAEAATGERAVALASAWDELQQAQVLRDEGFAHDLVSDAVLRKLPAPVARRLHAEVAAWLQSRGGAPARLAMHWQAAGHAQKAGPAWLAAARHAHAAQRGAEAVQMLDQALLITHWADADADAHWAAADLRCDLLLDLDLGPRLDAAQALRRQLSHTPAQRAQAAQAELGTLLYRGDLDAVVAQAPAALEAAQAARDESAWVAVSTVLARAQARRGAIDQAVTLMQETAPRADALGDDAACTHHGVLGGILQTALRVGEARLALQKSLALALQLERHADSVNLWHNLAICEHFIGRAHGALPLLQKSHEAAQRHGAEGVATQHLAATMAAVLLDLNRYRDAWPWIERAEADLRRHAPAFVPVAGNLRARWYLELGQAARVGPALAATPTDAGTPAFVAAYRALMQARQQRALGQDPAAALSQALALARASGRRFVEWEVQLGAAALGQAALAGDLQALAREARQHGFLAHEAAARVLGTDGSEEADWADAAAATALLLDPAISPRWLYRADLWLAVVQDSSAADAALAWLLRTALEQVPAEFRASFIHRNPANAALVRTLQRHKRLAGPLQQALQAAAG